MTEHEDEPVAAARERASSDEDVSRLLLLAGRRASAPEAASARVRRAAYAQWQAKLQARRRRRLVRGALLLAAGVALALGVGSRLPVAQTPSAGPARTVAVRVERTRGAALEAMTAGGAALTLAPGADLLAGTWLQTPASGRAALRAEGGVSLRLDTDTRVQVLSSSSYRLERGGLYVDSGKKSATASLQVRTAHGWLRDIGTQFEVRAGGGATVLRVRDGAVLLDGAEGPVQARAGQALRADGRSVARSRVPIYGPTWAWVEQIAPEFALKGQSLPSFLAWASRETGLELRFASARAARSADGVRLHGSAAGLTPSQALEAVLPTCGFELRREGGTGWIQPISAADVGE